MRKFAIALLALSLGGCATQFGTRIAPPMHRHTVQKSQVPIIVPAPAPSPEPAPAPTFKQRFRSTFGRIKWVHPK